MWDVKCNLLGDPGLYQLLFWPVGLAGPHLYFIDNKRNMLKEKPLLYWKTLRIKSYLNFRIINALSKPV